MAAFRKLVIALAVLAVFAGLASAQTPSPLNCPVAVSTNTIRSEGLTEQVGDIVLNCTNGNPLADGAAVPRATFKVTVSSTITSRVTSGLSDALLTIDQPGTTSSSPLFQGFGSDQPPTLCIPATGGCTVPAFKQTLSDGTIVMSSVSSGAPCPGGPSPAPCTPTAPNVFQGVVSSDGLSVTFANVPILPTGSANSVRVFRITNIRVDATGGSDITVSVMTTSTLVAITSGSGTVGHPTAGLSTSTTKVAFFGSAPICIGTTDPKYISAISFGENFGRAFKTRLAGTAAGGSVFTAPQNIPSGTYLGESGYTPFGTATGGIGVADFGTRLKATFSNIPAGVRLFVSATNMVNTTAANAGTAVGDFINGAAGSNVPTSFAQLIGTTDTTPDGPTGPPLAGTGAVELTVSTTGAATAVWEVFNTNPAASETLTFAVYVSYAANVPPITGTPSQPSPMVNLTYGPTFTPPATGPILHPIPNFVDADQIKGKVFDLSSCRTVLLFPYITSNAGFDTGIAISNTTSDSPVFSDTAQAGTCSLNWFPTGPQSGSTTSVGTAIPPTTTPTVVAGSVYLNVASALVPGFTGYMLAACNFQLAHGFVFIADWGNPNTSSAMGYLALVVPDVGNLGNRTSVSPTGENLNQ